MTWPSRVARDNPIEDLPGTYRLLLPGKRVTPLVFATLPEGGNLDIRNAHVADCPHRGKVPCLLSADPAWSAAGPPFLNELVMTAYK